MGRVGLMPVGTEGFLSRVIATAFLEGFRMVEVWLYLIFSILGLCPFFDLSRSFFLLPCVSERCD
jgi:hypothetical protein